MVQICWWESFDCLYPMNTYQLLDLHNLEYISDKIELHFMQLMLTFLSLVIVSFAHPDVHHVLNLPLSLTLDRPLYWVSTYLPLMVFGSMISPSSSTGHLLTLSLVDAIGNVVCMVSHTCCTSYLWSPYHWQIYPCNLT